MAEALYRKYRPQTFEDVVGQTHIERTLKNAIEQDKVSHAYLFCGPRGTGKTTTARLLAKALLCEHGPTPSPDGTCRECVDIANGVHPDVYELDAASRTGVENVREEIIGRVQFAPTRGKVKIYIIDEVHMLSTAAFNALLKTLEEPPAHVVFILCTTDPQKVPETIHSRCQRFDFHRLSPDEIVSRLGAVCVAEDVEFDGDALDLIAHRADGGMRNALTSLEQLIAFGEGSVTLKGAEDLLGSLDSTEMATIMRAIGARDAAACFNWVAEFVETGSDLAQFAGDLAQRIRNLYVLSMAGSDAALDVADAERRELAGEVELFGPDRLARMLMVLGDAINELRTASNQRLCFEIALTRMVRPDSDVTLASLAERVEALEAGHSAVAEVLPVAATAPAAAEPAPVAAPAPAAPASPASPAPAAASPAPRPVAAPAAQPAPAPAVAAPAPAAAPSVPAPAAATLMQQPAAQGGAAAASGMLSNPAALQRAWKAVVTAIKQADIAQGILLVNVKARPDDSGSGVVLEFPADNPFAFSRIQRPEMQETIRNQFAQALGTPVAIRCIQAAGAQTPSYQPVAAAAPAQPTVAPNRPAAPSRPAAAAAPCVPVQAPQIDDVPLDAYGDMDSCASEDVANAAPQAASAPAADPATAAAPVAPASSVDSAAPATAASVTESANDAAGEQPASADDLSALLSATLGEDIQFKEVDG